MYTDTSVLRGQIASFIREANQIEINQKAEEKAKERLEMEIRNLAAQAKDNREALSIATGAIDLLRQVSDKAVIDAYRFLEDSLNNCLARMFANTTRKIHLREYTRDGQYPQLEIELETAGGTVRSLKADSGHGIAQIVSLLSILSLIVITNSRRILVMDEVISGLSVNSRKIISDILWAFTEIGFQFIVNDHGFVPKGSKVYYLEMSGDVSKVKETYLEEQGVYLNNIESDKYGAGYTKERFVLAQAESDDNQTQEALEGQLTDANAVTSPTSDSAGLSDSNAVMAL